MKKRGCYSKDKRYEVKFRADRQLFERLKTLSDKSESAMALVIRELV